MTPDQQILDLQEQLAKLRGDFDDLSSQFYKNNFSSHQDFIKDCSFSTKLKIPSYSTLPNCQVGEIAESAGVLYICSALNTWTVVGTQT